MSTIPKNQDPIDREFADPWIPEPGDALRHSEVLHVSERPDGFNDDKTVPIVTVRVGPDCSQDGEALEEGVERAVHGIHTGLRYKFADLALKSGDVIAVKFLGWHRKGAPAEGLGPKEIPQGAKARDGSFRYRVIRYGDEKAGIDWSKFKDEDSAEQSAELDLEPDTRGLEHLPEHSRAAHRPRDDDADAATQEALEVERDERDGSDIPF
jgi:hypothetical protein